jgi:hypothetical protein
MSTLSMRQTASAIDRLYPPGSMRELLSRFRLSDAESQSFAAAARRVASPATVQISFLQYNVWLLRAKLKVKTLLEALDLTDVSRLIACLGLKEGDILMQALESMSTNEICDRVFPPGPTLCGVPANPLNLTCKVFHLSIELAEWLLDKFGRSLGLVIEVLDIPVDTIIDLIFPEKEITLKDIGQHIDERVPEIGAAISAYDLVSLVEAWEDESKDGILSKNHPASPPLRGPTPAAGWKPLSSGILVFSNTRTISNGGSHEYVKDGCSRTMPLGYDFGALVDSDKWAGKGVQRTLVDLGFGKLELYSTHLYSGGGMPDIGLGAVEVTAPDTNEQIGVRQDQVNELAAFIGATHDPRNVAVVTGDFNIIPGSAEYTGLVNAMSSVRLPAGGAISFRDAWNLPQFRKLIEGASESEYMVEGMTNRHGDEDDDNDRQRDFSAICRFNPNLPKPASGSAQDYYCDDAQRSTQETPAHVRLDYVFVQSPDPAHAYTLDLARLRRRPFLRNDQTHSEACLSDHVGLETTFYANPRA